jgi:formate dehydrogenase major subunit
MDNVINLKINGKEVTAVKGQTILQVAKENGIDIPNMCYSEKVKSVRCLRRLCR